MVKDYNNGKVYLVDGRQSDNPEDYDPNINPALKEQGNPLAEETEDNKDDSKNSYEQQDMDKAKEIIQQKIDKGELPTDTNVDDYYKTHPEILNEISDKETK